MLNSYDSSKRPLRDILAVEADKLREAAEQSREAMVMAEAEKRKGLEAIHARNVAEMQRQQAALNATDPFSGQGAIAAIYLLVLIGGIFLIASLLGN